jgi:hypothetical protein
LPILRSDQGCQRHRIGKWGQIRQIAQAEQLEELAGRAILHRPTGGLAPAQDLYQPPRHKCTQDSVTIDSADRLDLPPSRRLSISDDGERLQNRPREARRPLRKEASHPGRIRVRGAKLKSSPGLYQAYPAGTVLIVRGKVAERRRNLRAAPSTEGPYESGERHRLRRRKERGLEHRPERGKLLRHPRAFVGPGLRHAPLLRHFAAILDLLATRLLFHAHQPSSATSMVSR